MSATVPATLAPDLKLRESLLSFYLATLTGMARFLATTENCTRRLSFADSNGADDQPPADAPCLVREI
jgi:hypothetical protein